jgi:hypothetical protein
MRASPPAACLSPAEGGKEGGREGGRD